MKRPVDKIRLTKKQKEVLDFVTDYIARNDIAPSNSEIAEHLNLSSRHVKRKIHDGTIPVDKFCGRYYSTVNSLNVLE